jgi:dTDP-4-dehydrorhamnose 3,5-epimerase
MQVIPLEIPDVKLVSPARFQDARGFLSEVYNKQAFASAGIDTEFVQDNHSASEEPNTVRGLHFQSPPFAQAKLVRVVRGAAFDVAVDLRRGSPTYGRHVSAVLSAEAWNQMFIPHGFAHGFCTLEPDTEVVYKLSAYHAREHDMGLYWNDPDLGIAWPVAAASGRARACAQPDRPGCRPRTNLRRAHLQARKCAAPCRGSRGGERLRRRCRASGYGRARPWSACCWRAAARCGASTSETRQFGRLCAR